MLELEQEYLITRDALIAAAEKACEDYEDTYAAINAMKVAREATAIVADWFARTSAYGPCGCLIGTMYVKEHGALDRNDFIDLLDPDEDMIGAAFPRALLKVLDADDDNPVEPPFNHWVYNRVFVVADSDKVEQFRRTGVA